MGLNIRRVLIVGLLLTVAIIAALNERFSTPPARPPTSVLTAQPDWNNLQRFPLSAVIDDATRGDHAGLVVDETRTAAQIAARPADLRRLAWLAELAHGWGRDGLHTFFFVSPGADFAPEIEEALTESGLTRQATVFSRAIALWGDPYPREHAVREKPFAWSQPGRKVDQYTTIPNDPNAFDNALFALSAEFGSLDSYWRAVDGVVERSPTLSAWADAQRAAVSDSSRLDWLTGRLAVAGPDAMGEAMRGWPRPYQILYLLDLFNGEMLNGSVHQFFFNSSGALAPDVVLALREAGLPKHAAAVQRGIDMFRSPYPRNTEKRRAQYFAQSGTTPFDEALNGLTGDVDDGAIGPAMINLANRQNIMPR